MVYIAPLPGKKQQKQHNTASTGARRLPIANSDPEQHHHNSRPAPDKGLNVQNSKQDLLQELTRQAEWNTLVLQREQAALRALQESQTGTLPAQALAQALAGAALNIMGPPAGLAPVVTKSKNHRFFDVAPKTVDPKQVPGLATSPPVAALAIKAGVQQGQGSQQQQASIARLEAAQQSPVRQRQQQQAAAGGRAATAEARNAQAAGKQQQQKGRNAQRQRQPALGGKAVAAQAHAEAISSPPNGNEAVVLDPAVADGNWQEQDVAGGQLSPFAAADWRFEYPDAGQCQKQQQQGVLGQTFPDSPQFRSGMVFEIPAGVELPEDGQCATEPYSRAGAAAARQQGYASAAIYAGANIPLAQLVEQQQQQQGDVWLGESGDQSRTGGFVSSPTQAVQQQQLSVQALLQPHLLLQSCHTLDELAEAMRLAQAYPHPELRAQLVKELKQRQYKLELEQQIAEREAARQAVKAAAAAREAAEEAARAAAPPRWDPVARAHRLGGGGEPLISIDGMPVADLRGMRDRLPVPGTESSQTFSAVQPPPQLTLQLQAGLSSSQAAQLMQAAGSHNGVVIAANSITHQQAPNSIPGNVTHGAAAPAAIPAANKGFMGALNELRAGPSIEQRAAAAAARQKLLEDLQSQVAEKAARAAAEAAADAARAAREEEALRHYYTQQQLTTNPKLHQSLHQQCVTSQNHQLLNPLPWVQSSVGITQSGAAVAAGGSASSQAMLQALAPEASKTVLNAGAAASAETGSQLPRKGRSKKVIQAPWLDQLQQQQQGQPAPQQQHCQPGLATQPSSYAVSMQADRRRQQVLDSSVQQNMSTTLATLQQSSAAAELLSSQKLATALQKVQQQQALMREEFACLTKALERLMDDKQVSAADSSSAWAELQRVRNVLQQAQEQQQALQEMLDKRQQQNVVKDRRQGQQQEQDGLLTQQHSTVQVNSKHQQQHQKLGHSSSDEIDGDSLDAFMVETQLVPVTVNAIPESVWIGDSLMQLMLPPLTTGSHCSSNPHPPVQHCNRYATYGLDAELSSCSTASNIQQGRASARGSSSAAWGAWLNSQQPLSHRPPASPPILRSDRFADKPPDSKRAVGSGGEGSASHRHGKASGGGSNGPANKTKSRIAAAGAGAAKHSTRRRI